MSSNPIYNQPLNADPNYNQYYQGSQQQGYPNQPGYQTPYGQAQQPIPVDQQAQQSATYDYNPYEIQYQRIQIDSWNQIPPDPSPYSQMWATPQSFEPQSFSTNTKVNRTWNDLVWNILFWVNFVVTFAVVIWLGITFKNMYENPSSRSRSSALSNQESIDTFSKNDMLKAAGVGLAVSVLLNVCHYCYATFAPLFYIKAGMFVGVVVSILLCIIPVLNGSYYFILYPIFSLILTLLMYCCMKKYIKMSAAVMVVTCKIVRRYPSIVFLVFLQSVWEILISLAFSVSFYFVEYTSMSRFLYIYLVFSYFWITLTFGYVVYMTGAGLAASWYFLNETQYFPSSPVWESFKRASTTSFGSASFAGFILAVIKSLQVLVRTDVSSNSDSGAVKIALMILRCIAMCILNILEACFSFINRYALIYCAIFGVPFKEGCRRWCELSCHRFCNVIMSGCCIDNALTYNGLLFVIGGAVFGYGLGIIMFKNTFNEEYGRIFTCVFSCVFTFAVFAVLAQPITTVADTLLVCFAESPEKLKTSANELYEELRTYYHGKLDEVTSM